MGLATMCMCTILDANWDIIPFVADPVVWTSGRSSKGIDVSSPKSTGSGRQESKRKEKVLVCMHLIASICARYADILWSSGRLGACIRVMKPIRYAQTKRHRVIDG